VRGFDGEVRVDVEEEERLVAEAQETAKAWVDSLAGDVNIAPK